MITSTTYFIAHEITLPTGARILDARLSRAITRVSTLKRVFRRVRRRNPDAFCVQANRYR